MAQWDLQTDDEGTVNAVRYGRFEGDPEHTQTLANLKSRVTTAAPSDSFANSRIGNVGGLTQYYRDIGAYGNITPDDGETTPFTPSQPPPVYAPAPASLWLRDNSLSGGIPQELEDLNLTALHLSGNSFSGCIPSGLRDVETNDLNLLGLDYCTSPES